MWRCVRTHTSSTIITSTHASSSSLCCVRGLWSADSPIYAQRRCRLLHMLPPNSVLILPAADDVWATHDITLPHRQHNVFQHLFGLDEPLRRMRAPPTSQSISAEDVHLTTAVLCHHRGGDVRTAIFLPNNVADENTCVWAMPLRGSTRAEVGELLMQSEMAAYPDEPHTLTVHDNDLLTVVHRVQDWLKSMAVEELHHHTSLMLQHAGATVDRGVLRQLALLPRVLVCWPAQLRWLPQRHRLPIPRCTTSVLVEHPLHALLSLLSEVEVELPLAAPLCVRGSTTEIHRVCCSYATPRSSHFAGFSPLASASEDLRELLTHTTEASNMTQDDAHQTQPQQQQQHKLSCVRTFERADSLLWDYRAVKSPSQLTQHVLSAAATRHAHYMVMRAARTSLQEHHLFGVWRSAVVELSQLLGCDAHVGSAYIPVMASGHRALEIHYTENNNTCRNDEPRVMRMDAGVEVYGVPTDCTRTFFIGSNNNNNGTSSAHDEGILCVHEAVLAIQRALLRRIHDGVMVGELAMEHLRHTQRLLWKLGVGRRAHHGLDVEDEEAQMMEEGLPMAEIRRVFCAHTFGHFFGLDIHEESHQPTPRRLCAGMMHTVEPGIYIPNDVRAALMKVDVAQIPPKLRGVGVQLEDAVLVLPSRTTSSPPTTATPGWRRHEYLAAVMHAYAHAMRVKLLPSVPLEVMAHATSLTEAECVALWVLFEQRQAVDGCTTAMEALASDAKAVRGCVLCVKDEVCPFVVCEDGWYPYDVVVVSACVPKEMEAMEAFCAS